MMTSDVALEALVIYAERIDHLLDDASCLPADAYVPMLADTALIGQRWRPQDHTGAFRRDVLALWLDAPEDFEADVDETASFAMAALGLLYRHKHLAVRA